MSWTLPSWGSDTHARRPERGAGDLDVHSGGLVLAGVQLGVVSPGPALKQGAVDDQLHGGIQVLHSRHTDFQGPGDQGCVGGDDSGGGGLRDAVDLGDKPLGQVVPQVRQGQAHAQVQPQHPGPERRQVGIRGVNGLAQVHNLAASDPRATIHHGGLFLVELA